MKEAGKQFVLNLANLFKVKTILSLEVIITTCILTFKNFDSQNIYVQYTPVRRYCQ